jgi:tetratricopeptide (TPR) repeat protein
LSRTWFQLSIQLLLAWAPIVVAASFSAQSPHDPSDKSQVYEKAIARYTEFLANPPKGTPRSSLAKTRTDLATAYFMLHRYSESLEVSKPVIDETSRFSNSVSSSAQAQAWLVRGLDYLELDRPGEATFSLRQAVAANSNSGTARLALGDALARSGQLEEASLVYAEQTRRTPSLPEAWYKLGLAHIQIANELPRTSSPRFGQSALGQQFAAERFLLSGNNHEAAKILSRLARQGANLPGLHAELGMALLGLGYAKSGEAQFNQEVVIDPFSPMARVGLAETAALRGDWQEVTAELVRAEATAPRELARLLEFAPAGIVHQAWTMGMQLPENFARSPAGNAWKAWVSRSETPQLSSLTSTKPSCSRMSEAVIQPGAWLPEPCYQQLRDRLKSKKVLITKEKIKLAEAEFRLGNYQSALREAKHLTIDSRQNEWGIFWLSKAHAALAADYFVKVGSLNSDSARVHQMLAQHYASWSDYGKATSEYQAAIRLAPDLPDLHLALGTVHWQAGEWPEAEQELRRTLELAPGSVVAHYELGNTYLQQRQWQRAITELRQVGSGSPLMRASKLDLSKAESEAGLTQQALQDLLPIAPDDKDGEVHYRLAALYRKLGDRARAEEALATFKQFRAASQAASAGDLDLIEGEQEKEQSSSVPHQP